MFILFVVGHGKSDGDRVHIEDFQIYVRDVIQHIEMLKAKYSNTLHLFCLAFPWRVEPRINEYLLVELYYVMCTSYGVSNN